MYITVTNVHYCYKRRLGSDLLLHQNTHSYLLSGDDQPTCASYDAPVTVKHILLDCPYLHEIRQMYFTASVEDIFESVYNQNIVDTPIDHKL